MKWPVDIKKYPITQNFGENPASYAKFGIKGHNGIDIGCPTGTTIHAPINGKVIEAASDPTGYGLYLKIENDKEGVVLAHNQSFLVKVGDSVSEGQDIAISNNTGNSTGSHSHFGYYTFPRNRQNGYAGFIDQAPLIGGVDVDTQKTIDDLRKARDDNWNMYQQEKAKRLEAEAKIKNLESHVAQPTQVNDPKADKLKTALKEFLS